MTFAIITHVDHIIEDSRYYGYAPYVKEMNLWAKNVDEMIEVVDYALLKEKVINPININ